MARRETAPLCVPTGVSGPRTAWVACWTAPFRFVGVGASHARSSGLVPTPLVGLNGAMSCCAVWLRPALCADARRDQLDDSVTLMSRERRRTLECSRDRKVMSWRGEPNARGCARGCLLLLLLHRLMMRGELDGQVAFA